MIRLLAMALGLAMASGAGAQTSAPTPVEEVVVEGRLEEAVRKFVEEVAEPGSQQQLAQWRDTICPGVIGLRPDQNAFFARRLVRDAQKAGIRIPKKSCAPNVMVVFTDNSDAFSAAATKRHPGLFRAGGVREQRNEFKAATDPVRWWVVTRPLQADGMEPRRDPTEPPSVKLRDSRLVKSVRTAMARVLVVVDTSRTGKVTFDQLAGYLSMTVLSRTRPGADGGPGSILSLFNDETGRDRAPPDLTVQDRAYLASLQRIPGDLRLDAQKRTVATRKARVLSDDLLNSE